MSPAVFAVGASVKPVRLACVGAFGHTNGILAELRREGIPLELMGWAPAYADEPVGNFLKNEVFGDVRQFGALDALLEEKPDWVIVSSRLDQISQASAACLRGGAHVIAEKPLATKLNDLVSLHEAWKSSGRHLSAMMTMENEPAFQAAARFVHSGRLGQVMLAEGRKSYKWGTRPEWFGDEKKYGGTFSWIGIHALNLVQFTSGLFFTGGSARKANLAHPSHPGCEDVCVASLTLNTGALANITVDVNRPQSAPTHGDDWCRIVGTEGVLEANGSEGWCRVIGKEAHDLELPPMGARFSTAIRRVAAGDLGAEQTAMDFHLTETSLLARDASAGGEAFYVSAPSRWQA